MFTVQKVGSSVRLEELALSPHHLAQLRTIAAHGVVPGTALLFAGPSGASKRQAGEAIAGALGLGLFRIDLKQVVGHYVGETEKNLDRVFATASAGRSLLFFDEADALFGKRTTVKDSHDRYANVEVNYLLQKIEAHRGITILATSHRGVIDPAILKRLRYVIDFPFPPRR